jgi:hypothetical protein
LLDLVGTVDAPLVEQLDGANLGDNILGENLVTADGLDLDFLVIAHDCGMEAVVGFELFGELEWFSRKVDW